MTDRKRFACRAWLAVTGLVVFSGACSTTAVPTESSETHFLGSCGDGCGPGLTCLCGVCTRRCETSSECTGIAQNAACVPVSEAHPACTSTEVMSACDAPCTSKDDCAALGGSFDCSNGFCRLASPAPDATLEPSAFGPPTVSCTASYVGGVVNLELGSGAEQACAVGETSTEGKINPLVEQQIASAGGTPVGILVVVGDQGRPVDDTARAETQCCAIAHLQALGGTWVESFQFANAFLARVTSIEPVRQLAGRPDVVAIDPEIDGSPPP